MWWKGSRWGGGYLRTIVGSSCAIKTGLNSLKWSISTSSRSPTRNKLPTKFAKSFWHQTPFGKLATSFYCVVIKLKPDFRLCRLSTSPVLSRYHWEDLWRWEQWARSNHFEGVAKLEFWRSTGRNFQTNSKLDQGQTGPGPLFRIPQQLELQTLPTMEGLRTAPSDKIKFPTV